MVAILARNYNNNATPSTLSSSISNSATLVGVTSLSNYPTCPFLAGIERNTTNQEVVLVNSYNTTNPAVTSSTYTGTNTVNVTRGYDGTNAIAHINGVTFEHVSSAIDYTEANEHHTDTTRDDHTQYLNTARHNVFGLHLVGTSIQAGTPGTSNPGDSAAVGGSTLVASATHQHQRESYTTLLNNIIPVGVIFTAPWPQNQGPGTGFLFCLGQTVSQTTYPRTYAKLGTTWGPASGGNFTLPNPEGILWVSTGGALWGPGSGTGGSGSQDGGLNIGQTSGELAMPTEGFGVAWGNTTGWAYYNLQGMNYIIKVDQ